MRGEPLCASSRSSHSSSQAPKPTARGTPSALPAPASLRPRGAHCLEEKLAELISLGVRPGTADDVPPFVLAAAATVRLSAGAMRQLLLRFFLVPSSGYAQATTLLRRINAYLGSQWLSVSSTAALRNGPYGAIGEWAAKELPKAIVG